MEKRSWTFSQRIAVGFSATILLGIVIGVFSIHALRLVIKTSDVVVFDYSQELIDAESAHKISEKMVASGRGYLLTGDSAYLDKVRRYRSEFESAIARLHDVVRTPEGKSLVRNIEAFAEDYVSTLEGVLRRRKKDVRPSLALVETFERDLQPKRERLDQEITIFVDRKLGLLDSARSELQRSSRQALLLVVFVMLGAISLAVALAIVLTRTLTKYHRETEMAVRMREDVLAIVSHDLRNPLGAMFLNIELLSRAISGEAVQEKLRKPLGLLRDATRRMDRLISDLLDLSRLEAGQLPIQRGRHSAKSMVEDVLVVMEPLAVEKSLGIRREFQDSNAWVVCDNERIAQVLSNLIGNAIKFTPAGGLITVRTELTGGKVLFAVSDTGPGIPNDQLPGIFEKYRQARAGDRKRGTGLGLYIAKGIVEAHGGRIWVASVVNEGSRFVFSLPVDATSLQRPKS